MNFSERLEQAMNEAGLTQGKLAKMVSMAQSSINKLLNGAKGSRNVVEIANVLGVRPEWLAYGEGPKHEQKSDIPPQSEWKTIDSWDSKTPMHDDEVEVHFLKDIEFACGNGRIMSEDHNGFMLRFSKSTLRRIGANSDGSGVICFPARGNSMEPVIPDGTTIAIDTNNKRIVDGKIYAIGQPGAGDEQLKRIKQLFRQPGGKLIIRSFNREEYPDEEADMDQVEIIGRMFWTSTIW